MTDCIGLYPINRKNRVQLKWFEYKETIQESSNTVVVFSDEYRKIKVDVVFNNKTGDIFISDEYGETMNRNNIKYVFIGDNNNESEL